MGRPFLIVILFLKRRALLFANHLSVFLELLFCILLPYGEIWFQLQHSCYRD